MLSILALLLVVVFSMKGAGAVWSEADIYQEFVGGCHLPLAFLAILPLGLLALLFLPPFVGWIPAAIVASACFIPGLVGFRRRVAIFDRSGTSRTANALKSAHMGFAISMAGLLYVAASIVYSLAVATL